MRQFETVVETLNVLRTEGFTRDFNLCSNHIACPATGQEFQTTEFSVLEFYRFEGMNDPDDSMILYAVEAADGSRGTFLQAYGAQADTLSAEMAAHLNFASEA